MHTIDLLKGQGIPPKTTLSGLIFNALVLVFPLLVGAALIGIYAINKTNIGIGLRQKEGLLDTLEGMQPDTQETASLKKEKNSYVIKLSEASKCIDAYYQWTPILISLVKEMPGNMVIDNIVVSNISQGSLKKSTDPNKPLVIPIPKKKMTVELSGNGNNAFNMQVQEYQEKLKSDESLEPVLGDLTYVKQAVTALKPDETFMMNFVLEKKKK